MKDMKMSEEEKKEMLQPTALSERSPYPCGLKIHLDEDSYKKLEFDDAPVVGQEFMILAKVVVESVSQQKTLGDDKNTCCSLQITEMDIKPTEEKKSTEAVLYGE